MKLKTHSGTKKRTKLTGRKSKNGGAKFRFGNANHSHLLSNKSKKSKKRNSKGKDAPSVREKILQRLLPNS